MPWTYIHKPLTVTSEYDDKDRPIPHGLYCICGHSRDMHGKGAIGQCEYHKVTGLATEDRDTWYAEMDMWFCPCKKFADVREVSFECPR